LEKDGDEKCIRPEDIPNKLSIVFKNEDDAFFTSNLNECIKNIAGS